MFAGFDGILKSVKYFKAAATLVISGYRNQKHDELEAGVTVLEAFAHDAEAVIKNPIVLLMGDPFQNSRKVTQDACAKFGVKI